jgi:hypothetical protein
MRRLQQEIEPMTKSRMEEIRELCDQLDEFMRIDPEIEQMIRESCERMRPRAMNVLYEIAANPEADPEDVAAAMRAIRKHNTMN